MGEPWWDEDDWDSPYGPRDVGRQYPIRRTRPAREPDRVDQGVASSWIQLDSVIDIQRVWRGHLGRCRARRRRQASRRLDAEWDWDVVTDAVLKIQAAWRSYVARQWTKQLRRARHERREEWLRQQMKEHNKSNAPRWRKEMKVTPGMKGYPPALWNTAAATIQACWRGFLVRRRVATMQRKHEMVVAAEVMQQKEALVIGDHYIERRELEMRENYGRLFVKDLENTDVAILWDLLTKADQWVAGGRVVHVAIPDCFHAEECSRMAIEQHQRVDYCIIEEGLMRREECCGETSARKKLETEERDSILVILQADIQRERYFQDCAHTLFDDEEDGRAAVEDDEVLSLLDIANACRVSRDSVEQHMLGRLEEDDRAAINTRYQAALECIAEEAAEAYRWASVSAERRRLMGALRLIEDTEQEDRHDLMTVVDRKWGHLVREYWEEHVDVMSAALVMQEMEERATLLPRERDTWVRLETEEHCAREILYATVHDARIKIEAGKMFREEADGRVVVLREEQVTWWTLQGQHRQQRHSRMQWVVEEAEVLERQDVINEWGMATNELFLECAVGARVFRIVALELAERSSITDDWEWIINAHCVEFLKERRMVEEHERVTRDMADRTARQQLAEEELRANLRFDVVFAEQERRRALLEEENDARAEMNRSEGIEWGDARCRWAAREKEDLKRGIPVGVGVPVAIEPQQQIASYSAAPTTSAPEVPQTQSSKVTSLQPPFVVAPPPVRAPTRTIGPEVVGALPAISVPPPTRAIILDDEWWDNMPPSTKAYVGVWVSELYASEAIARNELMDLQAARFRDIAALHFSSTKKTFRHETNKMNRLARLKLQSEEEEDRHIIINMSSDGLAAVLDSIHDGYVSIAIHSLMIHEWDARDILLAAERTERDATLLGTTLRDHGIRADLSSRVTSDKYHMYDTDVSAAFWIEENRRVVEAEIAHRLQTQREEYIRWNNLWTTWYDDQKDARRRVGRSEMDARRDVMHQEQMCRDAVIEAATRRVSWVAGVEHRRKFQHSEAAARYELEKAEWSSWLDIERAFDAMQYWRDMTQLDLRECIARIVCEDEEIAERAKVERRIHRWVGHRQHTERQVFDKEETVERRRIHLEEQRRREDLLEGAALDEGDVVVAVTVRSATTLQSAWRGALGRRKATGVRTQQRSVLAVVCIQQHMRPVLSIIQTTRRRNRYSRKQQHAAVGVEHAAMENVEMQQADKLSQMQDTRAQREVFTLTSEETSLRRDTERQERRQRERVMSDAFNQELEFLGKNKTCRKPAALIRPTTSRSPPWAMPPVPDSATLIFENNKLRSPSTPSPRPHSIGHSLQNMANRYTVVGSEEATREREVREALQQREAASQLCDSALKMLNQSTESHRSFTDRLRALKEAERRLPNLDAIPYIRTASDTRHLTPLPIRQKTSTQQDVKRYALAEPLLKHHSDFPQSDHYNSQYMYYARDHPADDVPAVYH